MISSSKYGSNFQKEQFDDSEFINKMKQVKIKEIHLYDNCSYLAGYQIFYETCNQIVTTGVHCTTDVETNSDSSKWKDLNGSTIRKTTLKLDDDDYVERVSIRSGEIIDGITFYTKKGKSVSAGGNGGNLSEVSYSNKQFVALSGSHSTLTKKNHWFTIHCLTLYFDVLPNEKRFDPNDLKLEDNK